MIEHLYTMIIVITYFFFTENQFFYVIINPTFPRYISHILHRHPLETHILILNLKPLRDSDFFISNFFLLNPIFLVV